MATARDDSQIRLPMLGLLCLIGAAAGGGFQGLGFVFPTLTLPSRILIAILGFALISFEYRHQIAAWMSGHGVASVNRISLFIGAAALLGIAGLIAQRQFVQPDPPLEKLAGDFVPPRTCPVRNDGPGTSDPQTTWIYVGVKAGAASDALDAARNIEEPCVPRQGDTVTIYRQVHVWVGLNPAALSNGSLSVRETNDVLKRGSKAVVVGGISGPSVVNTKGQLLFYEVWAPVKAI